MSYVVFLLVLAGSWLVGVFGWAQIIGGFQNLKTRGPKMFITIIIWLAILGLSFWLVIRFLPSDIWAWVIGMIISFLQVLRQGKIE